MKPRLSSLGVTTGAVLFCWVGGAYAHGPLSVLEVLSWAPAATDTRSCGALDEVPHVVRTSVGPAVYDGAGGYRLLCPSRIGPSPTLALVAQGDVVVAPVSGGLRASSDGGCTFGTALVPEVGGATPLVTDVARGVDAALVDPTNAVLVFGRTPALGLLGEVVDGGDVVWVTQWPREDTDDRPSAMLPTTAFTAEGAGRWWTAGLFPTPRLARVRRGGEAGTGSGWQADAVELGPQPPSGLAPATAISGLDVGQGDGMYVALAAEGESPWARLWWRQEAGDAWVQRWAGSSLRGPVLAADRVWWVGDDTLWADDPRGVTWAGKRSAPAPIEPQAVLAAAWSCLGVTPAGGLAGCVDAGVVVLDPRSPNVPPTLRMGLEQLQLDAPWCGTDLAGSCAADGAHARQEYPALLGQAAACPGGAREVPPPDDATGTSAGCAMTPGSSGSAWAWLGLLLVGTHRTRRSRCD